MHDPRAAKACGEHARVVDSEVHGAHLALPAPPGLAGGQRDVDCQAVPGVEVQRLEGVGGGDHERELRAGLVQPQEQALDLRAQVLAAHAHVQGVVLVGAPPEARAVAGGEAQLREQAHAVVLEVARAAAGAVEAAAQAQHEVQGGLLLHVVVGERAAVLELLAREDEALLVRGDALLVLDLALDHVDGVRGLDLERDGLARQVKICIDARRAGSKYGRTAGRALASSRRRKRL